MARRIPAVYKALNLVHERGFTLSKGRVFGRAGGMVAVRLTTVGRKSGAERVTMLTSPLVEDGQVVLVASYRGGPSHPAWFLNLRDRPQVRAMRRGTTDLEMHADVLDGPARQAMWERLTALEPRYAEYQTRTDREIPVIVLRPTT
ncbi:MAG: nitroreductase/quinone reductase family protein [Acidimicrobiales bacterium]